MIAQTAFAADKTTESRVLYENRIPDGPAILVGEIGVAGKNYPLIIDTGAEATLLADLAAAKPFKEAPGEAQVKRTEFKGRNYFIPEATVGKLKIPAAVTPAYDFSNLRGPMGVDFFGYLGWKALQGRTLQLDHDAGKLRILNGAVPLPGAQATLPVTIEHNTPSFRAPLNGKDHAWLIDTGFNDTFIISSSHFGDLVEAGFVRRTSGGRVARIEGEYQTETGYFLKGSLLGVDLTGLSVTTDPHGYDVVGMLFLKKLNVALSLEPSRFSYSIRKNPPHPISEQLMLGIIFIYDHGQGVVARIKPESNAEKAGFKPGDRVEKIDELGDGPLDCFKLYDLCLKHAGKPVTLRVRRDGQPLTIQLPLTAAVDAWNFDAPQSK
ncbi:PDZ domain-containing protein [Luteolibacter ambystomatis]|uniref:PDZ domain-containing protein n=1 Tax=Luteolibacter ambystomatis TaxID=2824561 RepID=UPI0036DC3ABC